MPPPIDNMTELDRPVTRRELREELQAFATKDDLRQELRAFVTKDDLRQELRAFVTKDEFREELKALATKEEMNKRFDELRTHFDVVAESFRSEFNSLYDWAVANTNILTKRVRHIEVGHGSRLESLETGVMQLKKRRK